MIITSYDSVLLILKLLIVNCYLLTHELFTIKVQTFFVDTFNILKGLKSFGRCLMMQFRLLGQPKLAFELLFYKKRSTMSIGDFC